MSYTDNWCTEQIYKKEREEHYIKAAVTKLWGSDPWNEPEKTPSQVVVHLINHLQMDSISGDILDY